MRRAKRPTPVRRKKASSGSVGAVPRAGAARSASSVPSAPPPSLPSLVEGRNLFLQSRRYHAAGSRADLNFRFTSLVMQFSRRWRNRLNAKLAEIGQTQARWESLFWIEVSGGRATQRELAERVGIEGPTFVRMLDRLEKEGLVERRSSSADRRTKTIRLRKRAAPFLKQISDLTDELRAELLDDVPEPELAACVALMRTLLPRLERR